MTGLVQILVGRVLALISGLLPVREPEHADRIAASRARAISLVGPLPDLGLLSKPGQC